MTKNRLSSKGFTLPELVLTLTIVAILSVAILPISQDLIWEAKVAATKKSLNVYRSALRIELSRRIIAGLPAIPPGITADGCFGDASAPSGKTCLFQGQETPLNFLTDDNRTFNEWVVSDPGSCARLRYVGTVPGGGLGWAWYTKLQRIYAATTDCDKADTYGW